MVLSTTSSVLWSQLCSIVWELNSHDIVYNVSLPVMKSKRQTTAIPSPSSSSFLLYCPTYIPLIYHSMYTSLSAYLTSFAPSPPLMSRPPLSPFHLHPPLSAVPLEHAQHKYLRFVAQDLIDRHTSSMVQSGKVWAELCMHQCFMKCSVSVHRLHLQVFTPVAVLNVYIHNS